MNEDDEENFEQIEATFGFMDMLPSDAPAIAGFIPKYLNVERVELSKIITGQKRVGTCIKLAYVEDEDDQSLFGFTSVVNLGYFQNYATVSNFINWLLSLNDPSLNQILGNFLPSVGLLLDERAYGVPPQLIPHLIRGLFEEIEWATEDCETQEERDSYKFTHYILVKKAVKGEEGLEFQNAEDQVFFKNAMLRIEFKTEGEEGDFQDLEYYRYVMVLTRESIFDVRREINEMFDVNEDDYKDEGIV
ncbi:protein BCCIP [Histomonas meleagridis]|uniref:protein BCCIP-like n=1 Tax=Histomonas meleagridis TaxID=135588 RepID=UPI003559A977|nr:protein BCCIP [Histomonas meleagridis]KAH0806168.1 protein BCCIP-like [Histomonas meleagridis]